MDGEKILIVDSYILLSWVNMKLRDEFDSLQSLCEENELTQDDIINRLKSVGYKYSEKTNQFISLEA